MLVDGRLPTVPEYYTEFINGNVDLAMQPKQCCPFHKEDTPSFSYNIATGRWSCFGACHAHGDVIEMHKRWFHFATRDEAERDLNQKCKISKDVSFASMLSASRLKPVSEELVNNEALYNQACMLVDKAPTQEERIERYLELDYEMSKTPFDAVNIQVLVNKWLGKKSLLED